MTGDHARTGAVEIGEQLPVYRPPLDMHRLVGEPELRTSGELGVAVRYLTPHSK